VKAAATQAEDDGAPSKTPFDPSAARSALTGAQLGPARCGERATGRVRVTVTFAPSGRVVRALVDDGLQGTPAGSCVARGLQGVQVPAFDGDPQTVTMHLTLK